MTDAPTEPRQALTEAAVLAAADHLVAAFAATDTDAYFACFAPDATFVFHTEPARLDDRAAYEARWASWLADGWQVLACASTERKVQVAGSTAIFTHTVRTTVRPAAGAAEESYAEESYAERETIVFTATGAGLVAVHEHLSPIAE
ncbi:nuclear transport factor 2 family protein [Pimelobacter simplex]|uniref:nuclear transport factor 2 family protein n=1 Tax=Nocardioides simplex TaxID=2045 RepID=UPI00214FCBEF|nr:nuclear transport factor 2 family protein [Pimelobacter simplex]UUW89364.1 nuclear transport factor 2 family protein [Pimelobacter simplex]UUW93192.1 nuclear transport factor 2 family protein [Pimelobacter simplex]